MQSRVTPPVTTVDPVIPSTPSTGGSEPDGDYAVTVDRTTGGKGDGQSRPRR